MSAGAAQERRDRRTTGRLPGGVRTYSRTFLVVTSDGNDGANTVLSAAGLPGRLQPYSTVDELDSEALVVDRDARQLNKSARHWEVDIFYSTDVDKEKEELVGDPDGAGEGGVAIGDILLEPAVVTFGFEVFRTIAVSGFDDTGDEVPIENSAQQPFDPPLMKDESRPVLTVERNQLTFDPLQAIAFQDAINADKFIGAEEGQVKVKGITARKEIAPWDPEIKFWRVAYIFVFRKDGWDLEPLDHGTQIVDPNDSSSYIPHTKDGVVTDVKLDGAGSPLTTDTTSKKPKFLRFRVYEEKNFSELGIDQTLGIQDFNPLF